MTVWTSALLAAPGIRLVENGNALDRPALMTLIADFARHLGSAGIGPGDRVQCIVETSASALALLLAVWEREAVAVPTNARLSPSEADHVRRAGRVRLTLGDGSAAATAHVLRIGEAALDQAWIGDPTPGVAAILFTSGTTGIPKGVCLSAEGLLFMARAGAARRQLRPEDQVLAALPIAHVYGLGSVVLAGLMGGSTLHLSRRFDAPAEAANFAAGRYTRFSGVPTMFAGLLRGFGDLGVAPRGVVEITTGGAPLDPALKRLVEARFGLPVGSGYGATECNPMTGTEFGEASPEGAVGRPIPGVEIRLCGAAGDVGEVEASGPNRLIGYFDDPHQTDAVLTPDGFYKTGDLGRFDEDGRLRIVGRRKELIIRSGFNVYPLEVESVLNDHPAVAASAVVGRPGSFGDEVVVAFVEVRPGCDLGPDGLDAHCRYRLAGYKRPSRIHIVDRIPVGPSGKLLKAGLVEPGSSPLIIAPDARS